MTNESSIALGSLVDGRYALERSLGKGGMGEVFLARERAVGRTVALKLLRRRALGSPAARERFYREANTLGRLNHINIVRLYAVGEHHGMPYIVTELIAGMAVDQLLSRAGRLEWMTATHVANQAAAALSIAHAKGILHRDVKPANLIIGDWNDEQGHVWLLDFGIALPRADHKMTDANDVVGTPLFMSPEQAAGEPVDERTDIYSLGVTLFWLLTGRPPFATHEKAGVDVEAILDAHLDEEPRLLRDFCPDLPESLEVIVGRCLAKDAADRYPDAEALQAAFHALFRASLPPDHPLAFAVMRSRFLQQKKEAQASRRPHELTALSQLWHVPESDSALPAEVPAAPTPRVEVPPVAAPAGASAPVAVPLGGPPRADAVLVAVPAEDAKVDGPGKGVPPAAGLSATGRAPVAMAPSPSRAIGETANDARFYPVEETLRMPRRPRVGPAGTALLAPRSGAARAGTADGAGGEPPREARETLEIAGPLPTAAALPFLAPAPTREVPRGTARMGAAQPSSLAMPVAAPMSRASIPEQQPEPAQVNSFGRRSFSWWPAAAVALACCTLGVAVALLATAAALGPRPPRLSRVPLPRRVLVAPTPTPSVEPSAVPVPASATADAPPSATAPSAPAPSPAPAPVPRAPPKTLPKPPPKPPKKPVPPDPF